jgi:hypothetical protein
MCCPSPQTETEPSSEIQYIYFCRQYKMLNYNYCNYAHVATVVYILSFELLLLLLLLSSLSLPFSLLLSSSSLPFSLLFSSLSQSSSSSLSSLLLMPFYLTYDIVFQKPALARWSTSGAATCSFHCKSISGRWAAKNELFHCCKCEESIYWWGEGSSQSICASLLCWPYCKLQLHFCCIL